MRDHPSRVFNLQQGGSNPKPLRWATPVHWTPFSVSRNLKSFIIGQFNGKFRRAEIHWVHFDASLRRGNFIGNLPKSTVNSVSEWVFMRGWLERKGERGRERAEKRKRVKEKVCILFQHVAVESSHSNSSMAAAETTATATSATPWATGTFREWQEVKGGKKARSEDKTEFPTEGEKEVGS